MQLASEQGESRTENRAGHPDPVDLQANDIHPELRRSTIAMFGPRGFLGSDALMDCRRTNGKSDHRNVKRAPYRRPRHMVLTDYNI